MYRVSQSYDRSHLEYYFSDEPAMLYYGFLFIKYRKDLLWILAELAHKMSSPAKWLLSKCFMINLFGTPCTFYTGARRVSRNRSATRDNPSIPPPRYWILQQPSTRHKMDAAIVATVHSYCDNATKICGAHLTFYLSSKYVSQYHLYMPAKYCYKMMKIFEWYLVIDIDKFLLSHTRHKTCNAIFIAPSWPRGSCPVLP